jgi:hypothetical protein
MPLETLAHALDFHRSSVAYMSSSAPATSALTRRAGCRRTWMSGRAGRTVGQPLLLRPSEGGVARVPRAGRRRRAGGARSRLPLCRGAGARRASGESDESPQLGQCCPRRPRLPDSRHGAEATQGRAPVSEARPRAGSGCAAASPGRSARPVIARRTFGCRILLSTRPTAERGLVAGCDGP